jgi:hypothetical protein
MLMPRLDIKLWSKQRANTADHLRIQKAGGS